MIDRSTEERHRLRNLVQTVLLAGGMALLLAVSAELLFGAGVWPWVLVGVVLSLLVAQRAPSGWLLSAYRAKALRPHEAPQLLELVENLSKRAGLARTPALYWVPSRVPNAFAVVGRGDTALALTDGLLRRLTLRELAGVLAHEIGHIAHNDLQLMALADSVSRLTHLLALLGLLLALLSLPLLMLGIAPLSLTGLLLLVLAPTASALLQLALSRTREFDADLFAVHLTGDPEAMAAALVRLETPEIAWWQRLFMPTRREPSPSLLRSHPLTAERIARLKELRPAAQHITADFIADPGSPWLHPRLRVTRAPSQRPFLGLWH